MKKAKLVKNGSAEVLEVFGPTIGFLMPVSGNDDGYCVLHGSIPAGVSVPLHSHPDDESFYILSGEVEVLLQEPGNFKWVEMKPGDFVHIPGGLKHAWRNLSEKPVEGFFVTTPRLCRFFKEVGRTPRPGNSQAPTPEQLQYFMQVADRYHHWLGSLEENAEVGIPVFA